MKNECNIPEMMSKAKSAFEMLLMDNIQNGDPAEFGKSDFDYATDFEMVESIFEDAIEEVGGRSAFTHCDVPLDHVYDVLEGHWQKMHESGKFNRLSKEREEL